MAKAADNLNISQPSLSYAIASIEKELGVPLFEKDGRNIRLTNYGRIYLKYVQESLDELKRGSEYISELLDVNSGHINLGFTFTLGQSLIPKLIYEFNQKTNTQLGVFTFNQGTTADLISQLLDDKLDLIFASMPADASLKTKLNIAHLVDQEILAIVPNHSPLASRDSVSLQELVQYPFIGYSKNSGLYPRLHAIIEKAHVHPQLLTEAEEDHTIIGFVHYGFGVALIPNLPQLNPTFVKQLHIANNIGVHKLYAITKANHFLTPAVSRFQSFSLQYCKEYYQQAGRYL